MVLEGETLVMLPVGHRWVTMTNALARAGQGLTLGEKRLIMCAISRLDSKANRSSCPEKIRISASEFAEVFEMDKDQAYKQLKAAADHLFEREIRFFKPSYKRNGAALEASQERMRWVSTAKYEPNQAWVSLTFNTDLLPHLTGLQKQFTSYQLRQASSLRSLYSWRLLELLTRFESSGWAEYSVDDFATAMDATDKQRLDFNNIKRRIIEPAVKELSEKDNWLITWKAQKAGRKVTGLRFDFQRNPQGQLFTER